MANQDYKTYLALEQEPEQKYEYHDGFIVAMAGGTPMHALIMVNIGELLETRWMR